MQKIVIIKIIHHNLMVPRINWILLCINDTCNIHYTIIIISYLVIFSSLSVKDRTIEKNQDQVSHLS